MAKKVYIGGIQRFSTEDGPGIRTTVFLKGCTLACKWCHNPELINFDYTVLFQKQKCIGCTACLKSCPTGALSLSESGVNIDKTLCRHCGKCVDACCSGALHTSSVQMPLEEIMASVRRDREFYENSGGGITLSGGEILANPDMALRIAAAARDEGISVAIETSGYGNFEKLRALAELSDWVLFDIKHTDEARHRFYTGVSCALIQQNLQRLSEMPHMRKKLILRVPLIHEVNDDTENIERICDLMRRNGLEHIEILPYHSMGVSKARQMGLQQETFETPTDAKLNDVRESFYKRGLAAQIMGE